MNNLYLRKLSLQNFAIFERQEIEFDPSFNAIIGETGSGKSLILDALEIILGHRADKKFIRKNASLAIVEASFYCKDPRVSSFFDDRGHPLIHEEIIIKRIIYPERPSKSYVNFNQCSASLLIDFSQKFVDFVGQFDNQKLMNSDYQLKLIDQYGRLKEQLKTYQVSFLTFEKLQNDLQTLSQNLAEKNQRLDFLKFQCEEINKLNPSLEEEQNLLRLKEEFKRHEKLKDLSSQILDPLSDNESNNAIKLLKRCLKICESNPGLITEDILVKLQAGLCSLEDIAFQLSKKLSLPDIDFSIDDVMNKLHQYQKLKNKFQLSTLELSSKKVAIEKEIDDLEKIDEDLSKLRSQLKVAHDEALSLAKLLHEQRQIFADKLSKQLTHKIRHLNMEGAELLIDLSCSSELHYTGCTHLNFKVETNQGEGFHELKDIASGGELSRILLSCRQELATKDLISIFLFDEIDTGMGGETALRIGKALKEVASKSQVIAITHLPQIAHCAEKLIVVSKEASSSNDSHNKRTISLIKEVTGTHKKNEIEAMTPLH